MKLYLIRHGESISSDLGAEKTLSPTGHKEISQLAHYLAKLNLSVDLILHSEKLRAKQTANLLTTAFSYKKNMQSCSQLNPEGSVLSFLEKIYPLQGNILIVSHMPFLGKLASHLVVGNENQDILAFKTGTIACFEQLTDFAWIIQWVLYPTLVEK